MTSGIYVITNTVTGEQYVGSTIDFEQRWASHQTTLRWGRHANRVLQQSWRESGAEAFTFTILEEVADQEVLHARELFYINSLRPALNIVSTERARQPRSSEHKEILNTTALIETMNQVRKIVDQRGMTITAFVGQALAEKVERMKQEGQA